MRVWVHVFSVILLLTFLPTAAQEGLVVEAQRVEITAADGLTLVGDYYAVPQNEGAELPGVLLLHGSTSTRQEWEPLIAPLLEHGYHVLNVDQRAHGETRGDRDMLAMIGDVPVWLAWLREQPGVNDAAIATIGASMGTVPGMAGCAADAQCLTTIAISPGDFPTLDEAMFEQLSERGVLFIVGRRDNVMHDTRKLFDRTSGEATFHVYNSGMHGSAFFSARSDYKDSATDLVLNWLDDHVQRLDSSG